jgi:hypothetical protein
MPDWLTGALAIYAAVIATIVGVAELLRERGRDTPKLKVTVQFGVIGPPNQDVVFATASNVGILPVHVASGRFLTSDAEFGLQPAHMPNLPTTLAPTQSVDIHVLTNELRTALEHRQAEIHGGVRFAGAQFRDGSGNRYDGKKISKALRQYLRDHGIN